jgi:hypothetical protein
MLARFMSILETLALARPRQLPLIAAAPNQTMLEATTSCHCPHSRFRAPKCPSSLR